MANEINFTPIVFGAAADEDVFNDPLRELDVAIKLNKWDATTAPTINDDSTDGYSIGSRWMDVATDAYYICADATPGAAVWLQMAGGVSGVIDLEGTAGEALAQRDYVYLASDNKWYRVDIDAATLAVGGLRGAVVESGGIGSGLTGSVRVAGEVAGFAASSFDAGDPVYAAATPGALTSTKPTVTAGGAQKAIVQVGVATSDTRLLLLRKPAEYVKRDNLANNGSLQIIHPSDPQAKSRAVSAFIGATEYGASLKKHDLDLLTSLIAWWRLDESSAGTLPTHRADSHGDNDLSDIDMVASGTGKSGNCADFESTNSEELERDSESDLQTGDIDYTFSLWVKLEAIAGMAVLGKYTTTNGEYLIWVTAGGLISFIVYDGGTTQIGNVSWGSALSTGTWYHIICWHDAGSNQVGITVDNGTPVTAAVTGTSATTSSPFIMGSYDQGTGGKYDGMVDELGFWKRLLTSTERTWLYNSGNARRYLLEPVYLKALAGSGGTTDINTAGTHFGAIGNSGGTQYEEAQGFQVTAGQLAKFTFTLSSSTGSPTGGLAWEIRNDDGSGKPGTTILATGTITRPVASAENVVYLVDGPFLAASTTYHLVLRADTQSSGVFWRWKGEEPSVYANGAASYSTDGGSSWTANTNRDYECSATTSASTTNDKLAQSFALDSAADVGSVKLYLKKYGTPTGNLTAKIYTDSGGAPGSLVTNGTSNTVAASSLGTSPGWITFTFSTAPSLSGSTTYWIVLETSDSAAANCISWVSDYYAGYASHTMKSEASSTWSDESKDALFEVLAEDVAYEEPCVIGRWLSGTRDVGVRFDDGTGSYGDTKTTFKNVSGATLDLTCVVELA